MTNARAFFWKVTSKGQITIPVEVRRILGLNPQDKVIFRVVDGKVEVSPLPMKLEEAAGSVPALDPPVDYAEMVRIARRALHARSCSIKQSAASLS